MKSAVNLFVVGHVRPLLIRRWASTKRYEGIRSRLTEDVARERFDQWLKSLWFAPGSWTDSTKDQAIQVTKRYIPLWNFTLHGSINATVRLGQTSSKGYGKKSLPTTQWFSQPMTINSLSVLNVNVYAAQNLDRAHLNSLQISITNYPIVTLNNQSDDLEQWTVDKDTAFQIGWDQNIVPRVKQTLIQQAQQNYPQLSEQKVDSFHFNITRKDERILYYPIYVIQYQYGSQTQFTCLVDGTTGAVQGDRQYSMTKVALTTFVGFYPMVLSAIACVGALIDPTVAYALVSLVTWKMVMPVAAVVAPLAGFYAKNYPKIYRERVNQQRWQNYKSNASQFTYDFTEPFQQRYQSYQQQQQRSSRQQQQQQQQEKQEFGRKEERRREEGPMDLYNLLSVSRTATDKEIKRAYLMKAKELHPDLNPGDKKAEEMFKKVNQAYAILSDSFKREQYDKYGYESVKYN